MTDQTYRNIHNLIGQFAIRPTHLTLEKVRLAIVATENPNLDGQLRSIVGLARSSDYYIKVELVDYMVNYLHKWVEVERLKLIPGICGATFDDGTHVEWMFKGPAL